MSLGDIYNLLARMQKTIGAGCSVSISIHPFNILEIKTEWLDNSSIITYSKAYDEDTLRYIVDKDFLVDWYCFEAVRQHKLKTVGED